MAGGVETFSDVPIRFSKPIRERMLKLGKAKGAGAADVAPLGGRRLIVFVLGGMCHSELRSVHEVARAPSRGLQERRRVEHNPFDEEVDQRRDHQG